MFKIATALCALQCACLRHMHLMPVGITHGFTCLFRASMVMIMIDTFQRFTSSVKIYKYVITYVGVLYIAAFICWFGYIPYLLR